MLISHMSEDDETHFYGLCLRPLVTKGLKVHAGYHSKDKSTIILNLNIYIKNMIHTC